jgi:RNA polymerase sigma factor (sigma-70 family)
MDHATSECLPESSLLAVFSSERPQLERIIAGMGLNASDGEDVLQDVSIRALKQQRNDSQTVVSRASRPRTRARCPRHKDSVRWLIKVTVNRCLMEHRRRRTFRRHTSEILKRRQESQKDSKAVVENAIIAEELDIVRESLQKLDDSMLATMVLRYFCDLNSTEIGEILALSPSTVRSRLLEARMILAKDLLERGLEP